MQLFSFCLLQFLHNIQTGYKVNLSMPFFLGLLTFLYEATERWKYERNKQTEERKKKGVHGNKTENFYYCIVWHTVAAVFSLIVSYEL